MEKRLFDLRAQTVIDELVQIKSFLSEFGKYGFDNQEVLGQINDILDRLRSGDRSYRYTRIVHVLTKYLSRLHAFSIGNAAKNLTVYMKLFESTIVAIIRELDLIETER